MFIPCPQFGRRAATLVFGLGLLAMAFAPADAQTKSSAGAPPISYKPPPGGGTVIPQVTPDGGNVTVSAGVNSYTFTVWNTGTAVSGTISAFASCSGAVSGCTASVSSFPLESGASRTVIVSYTAASAGGTGTIVLEGFDPTGGNSDQGFVNVTVVPPPPTYNVGVTPYMITYAMAAGTSTYNFTVTNTGNTDATYALLASCGEMATGCSAPTSVFVPHGGAVSVPVTFTASTPGSTGIVSLTASYGGYIDTGLINVTVNNTYTVTVLPVDGAQILGADGSVTFTVVNTGSVDNSYALSVNCPCTVAPRSGTVPANWPAGVPITVRPNGYVGTITLTASDLGHGTSGQGSITVVPPTYTVSVSPDAGPTGPTQQVDAGQSGSQTFTVANSGNSNATYGIAVSCPATYLSCSAPTSLPVNSHTNGNVTVYFTATRTGGVGTIALTATGPNTSDAGTAQWLVATHTASVTPKGGSATAYVGPNRTQSFTVTNTGNVLNSYTITPACLDSLSACTVSPASITNLGVGASQSVTLTYTAAGSAGVARVVATNTVDPTVTDIGSVNVTVKQTHTVAMTPDGAAVQADAWTDASVPFTLVNNGSAPGRYVLTLGCIGDAVHGSCTVDSTTVGPIPVGGSSVVKIRFPAGAPRTTAQLGLIAVSLDDGTFDDAASAAFTVTGYGVSVTPDAQAVTPGAYAPDTRQFTVTNTGTTTRTFTFQTACAPPAATGCSANRTAATLAAGAATTVDVSYTAGDPGANGAVRLAATDTEGRSADGGTLSVTVGTSVAVNKVLVDEVNPGTTIERSQCLVFAIVSEVADECGALRITHALPAVNTLGKARVPTLLYSSDQVQGPTLAVNVLLADTTTIPLAVRLTVFRIWADGHRDSLPSRVYPAAEWQGGRQRRIAVPNVTVGSTGILRYSVEVRLQYADASPLAAPAVNGELAVVDRSTSYFGGGWWLAGLEQLHLGQYDGSVLWVAGDGSTRKYVNQHTTVGTDTVWLASAFTRPDTLLHRADGKYQRQAGNGLIVEFDAFGLHQRTVNRLGYATAFTYDGNNHLSTIQLPPVQSGGGPAHTYTFAYSPTSGLLDMITAPSVNGKTRQVALARNGATPRVEIITELLGDSTYRVAFDTQPGLLYAWRSDRRAVRTNVYYEPSLPTVARFNTATGVDTFTVEHTFRPAGSIGASSASLPLESAYFRYDAPRPLPVADITKFWLDRFGAPTRIVNAADQETRIARGDPRFPGLATETRGPAPKYFTTWATYDGRGNLVASTDVNPRDDLKDASTTYAWDPKWDEVTRVTLPGGETTTFGIDATTGNRIWQEDGRGAVSHVAYYYGADLQLRTIQLPGASCSATVRTECQGIDYDALGNVQRVVSERDAWTTYDRDAIGRVTLISRGKGTDAHIQEKIDLDAAGRELLHTTTVPQDPDKLVTDASAAKQYVYVKHDYYRDGTDSAVTRSALPDTSSIGMMVTQYIRDGLGRVIKEIAPDGKADLTWFGWSGLVDSVETRRGYVTRNAYDALGRLLTRSADAVTYPSRQWGVAGVGLGSGGLRPAEIKAAFPRYGDGTMPEIHDTLAYDAAGNLSEANNPDARVLREYYPNGQLRQETLRIRTIAAGPVDDTHKYVTSHLYDIDGRDSVLTHPTQLVATLGTAGGATRYTYDRRSGALQSVTDPLWRQISFGINDRGELAQVTRPGAVTENRTYWPDGALATQNVVNGTLSLSWRTAAFDYNWQGSLVSRQDGARGEGFGARYSALGQLLSMADTTTISGQSYVTSSSDSVDAYGNAYKSDGLTSQNNRYANSNNYSLSSSGSGGAVRKYEAGTGRLTRTSAQSGTDVYLYDASGNVEFLGQTGYMDGWTTVQHESRHSYYDAANRLRFADYRTGSGSSLSAYRTAFEEYRYDALGRRVLVWSRMSCALQTVLIGQASLEGNTIPVTADVNPICRASFARRVVWDGNQELWEIQAPSDATGGPLVENDVNPITSGLSLTGASAMADPYTQYGLTAYTFGLELDRPVSVIRANWVGTYTPDGVQHTPQATSPMAFYPHYLDGGQAYNAAFGDGQTIRCVATSDGQRCLTPALNFRSDFLPWAQGSYVEGVWLGSLLSDKQDKALTFYRRNRVYDPLTRQFTQEDPLGLAGGLNAYGFANGDPVNYNDPFGLAPCCVLPGIGATIVANAVRTANIEQEAMLEYAGQRAEANTMLIMGGLEIGWNVLRAGTGIARNLPQAGNLAEQLGFKSLLFGESRTIAGGASGVAFRDAERVAGTYGGRAADWAKMSSAGRWTDRVGRQFETHWVENVKTGVKVEAKFKMVKDIPPQ